ncbi:hypothetical protein ABZ816_09700 [Actinosynnema sp. NPDC047251]|uniref:Putative membrane protein n=1 Tax=Saccharothrix espanaensis (strain ATCC 51144 / DSM 44229 / JCM 9112 / NBRC 15066 / NRRL 15764) TaxID=1179773 RepID=K0KBB0_SACES|nr:hypothetical protein [Saccharothrix espanaensis]CCH34084.1 putative membrane protein [Saccharothrix espanaensis DSM 44229]
MRDTPIEVRLAVLVGAVGGLLFVVEGLIRWQGDGDPGWIRFPIILLVLELLVAGGLLAGLRLLRPAGAVVYMLVGLIHLLAVLGEGPVWVLVLSGLLSALHIFGAVLLNTRPARLHFGGER